jgi:hypothetical protein
LIDRIEQALTPAGFAVFHATKVSALLFAFRSWFQHSALQPSSVLFSNRSSGESQKLRLCCDGLVLEQLQLLHPHTGILVSGDAYRFQTIEDGARAPRAGADCGAGYNFDIRHTADTVYQIT